MGETCRLSLDIRCWQWDSVVTNAEGSPRSDRSSGFRFNDCPFLVHDREEKTVLFSVVDECGASKYSITPLAEEELPGMPVTEKSAVSIGRRLIDPVSEFVKIEPRHLGIGMYQVVEKLPTVLTRFSAFCQ